MEKKKKLRLEILKTMVQLATAGFGLVAALAWNDAIKGLLDRFISSGNGEFSKLTYAIIITIIAVLVTYYLSLLIHEGKEDK